MIANLITLSRVFLVPLYLFLLFSDSQLFRFLALVVFCFASFTDYLDGLAARKLNQQSEFGKFLDPLADKLLVIGALCGFLYYDSLIPVWMVAVIILRDILVTMIRSVAMKKGRSIRTMFMAKAKTASQMITIIVISLIFIVQPPVAFKGFRFPSTVALAQDGEILTVSVTESLFRKFSMALQLLLSGRLEGVLLALPYWFMLAITLFTALSGIRYICSDWQVLLPSYGKKND